MQTVEKERTKFDLDALISRYEALVRVAEHEVSVCEAHMQRHSRKSDSSKLAREQRRLAAKQPSLAAAKQRLDYARQLKQVSVARSNTADLLAGVAKQLIEQE